MKNLILLGVVAGLTLAGCSAPPADAPKESAAAPATPEKPAPKPVAEAPAMPANLKHSGYEYYGLGNTATLVYEVTDASGTKREGTQTIKLTNATPDKAEFTISRNGMLVTGPSEELVEVTRDGVFVVKSSQGSFAKPTLELPPDLAIGKGWSVKSEMTAESSTIKIEATGKAEGMETVETPAGKFETIRVALTGTMTMGTTTAKITGKSWYANGVGMIRQEVSQSSGSASATIKIRLMRK